MPSASRRSARSTSASAPAAVSSTRMMLQRTNYVLLAAFVGLIVLGYGLMRWENEVQGVISLYVSPILLMVGYLGIMYALVWAPRKERPSDDQG